MSMIKHKSGEVGRPPNDDEQLLFWRLDQLQQAGYSSRLAIQLAVRVDIDLHGATALLERGCPQETALRILL
jgi:hypothetical protein